MTAEDAQSPEPPPPAVGPRAAPAWPYALAMAALVVLGVAFGLAARSARRSDPGSLDRLVHDWVVHHRGGWPALTALFGGVSVIGNPSAAPPLVLLVAIVLVHLGRRGTPGIARGEAAFWLALNASGWLLATGLKLGFHRERPPQDWWLVLVSSYSFPSIHSSFSAIFFGALGALALRSLPGVPLAGRLALLAVCLAAAATIAASRVWLGVHYATDVIGGSVLGLAWVLAAWLIRSRWGRKAGGPAAPGA